MECTARITPDLLWVGGNDRRLNLFENIFPIPRGVSYNSYLLLDEKTVLVDTVDKAISGVFFDNLTAALDGRQLNYIVVNHMEPDHAATLAEVCGALPRRAGDAHRQGRADGRAVLWGWPAGPSARRQ